MSSWPHVFGTQYPSISLSWLDDQFNQLSSSATSTLSVSGAGLIGLNQSATYPTASLGLHSQGWINVKDAPYGAVGDGVTDDTGAIQSAVNSGRRVWFPAGTYVFSNFTVAADTEMIGDGRNATKLNTSTASDSVTLGGHRIHFADLWINQTGPVQGKGIVGSNKYYFTTDRVDVTGFDYDLYIDKALYHSHRDSHFTGGNHGLYYWGNAGTWNIDWFNNQIELSNVISKGTAIGCYIKGVGIKIGLIDVSASTVGLQISGDSTAFYGQAEIDEIYSELSNNPIKLTFSYASLGGGYLQGGTGTATPFPQMISMDNSNLIVTGNVIGLDFWTFTAALTNNSRLESNQSIGIGSSVASGNSTDGSSHVFVTDYEEGTFTLTLTGCSTSPTGVASYVKEGKIVTLSIPSIDATSTTTIATMTGLLSSIIPATNQFIPSCGVIDGGANFGGSAIITNGGPITLYKAQDFGATVFTASGVKGIQGVQVMSYSLF